MKNCGPCRKYKQHFYCALDMRKSGAPRTNREGTFASCAKNIGPWQEYKKGVETYGRWFNPPLQITDGALAIPKGPGVGIAEPAEVLKGATVVKEE